MVKLVEDLIRLLFASTSTSTRWSFCRSKRKAVTGLDGGRSAGYSVRLGSSRFERALYLGRRWRGQGIR